jgi:hypothetical protein
MVADDIIKMLLTFILISTKNVSHFVFVLNFEGMKNFKLKFGQHLNGKSSKSFSRTSLKV